MTLPGLFASMNDFSDYTSFSRVVGRSISSAATATPDFSNNNNIVSTKRDNNNNNVEDQVLESKLDRLTAQLDRLAAAQKNRKWSMGGENNENGKNHNYNSSGSGGDAVTLNERLLRLEEESSHLQEKLFTRTSLQQQTPSMIMNTNNNSSNNFKRPETLQQQPQQLSFPFPPSNESPRSSSLNHLDESAIIQRLLPQLTEALIQQQQQQQRSPREDLRALFAAREAEIMKEIQQERERWRVGMEERDKMIASLKKEKEDLKDALREAQFEILKLSQQLSTKQNVRLI